MFKMLNVSPATSSLVGLLITIGDVTDILAIRNQLLNYLIVIITMSFAKLNVCFFCL